MSLATVTWDAILHVVYSRCPIVYEFYPGNEKRWATNHRFLYCKIRKCRLQWIFDFFLVYGTATTRTTRIPLSYHYCYIQKEIRQYSKFFFFLIEYFALIERSTYTWKNWKEKTQSQYVLILSSWYQWYAKKKLERTKTRGKIEDLQFYALHAIAQINT